MNVSEAVLTRFSARSFQDRPVAGEQIRRILDRARWAPSGGNLQPWFVHVVSGKKLAELQAVIRQARVEFPRGEPGEYPVYPPELGEPYRSRRFKCGEDLYRAAGISREDKPARLRQFAKNLQAFGAPMVLFFSIDRTMGTNQWAHLGMFMQNIMLLALEEGLATCPQEAWSAFHSALSEFLGLPEGRMFYCGMAIGFADMDQPINQWRTERAPLEDIACFLCGTD